MQLPDAEELSEMTRRGMAIYDGKLKERLEPAHNNEFIAIHLDSEDYTLGRSTADAMRAMRSMHPDGQLVLMKIGSEPEYGLAARLMAGELRAGRAK